MTEPAASLSTGSDASASHLESLLSSLRRERVFARLHPREAAQTLMRLEERHLKAGEVLYEKGGPANTVWYVASGQVQLRRGERVQDTVQDGVLGEETAVNVDQYLLTAVAISDARVIGVPAESIEKIVEFHPEAKTRFYSLLVDHYAEEHRSASQAEAPTVADLPEDDPKKKTDWKSSFGWLASLVVPFGLYHLLMLQDFEHTWSLFFMVLTATIMLLVFGLVPEFVPGIFAITGLLFLGLAPSEVILSGFSSGSFFMALSLFGLGAIIADSGVTYRLVLVLTRYLPVSQFWYSNFLLLNGLLLTPILPSSNGRIRLITSLLADLIEYLGLHRRGKAESYLAFSTLFGVSFFGFTFLSSKSANFIVYGLLPAHIQQQFTWTYWLFATSFGSAVALGLYVLVVAPLLFRNKEVPKISRTEVEKQIRILGPVTGFEWFSLFCVGLFILGITTSSIHKIPIPWIGLGVFCVFLALGFMGRADLSKKIDWSFLILLGSLIGVAKSMSYLGIDEWIGGQLSWLAGYMRDDFATFTLLLFVCILGVRFLLPNTPTVAVLATIFIPMAQVNSINPWIVGVLILAFSDTWILPYQSGYFMFFRQVLRDRRMLNEKMMILANAISLLLVLVAVYASFPFWRWIGLL